MKRAAVTPIDEKRRVRQPEPPSAGPTRGDLVDEYGRICSEVAPLEKRKEQIAGIIRSWYADAAAGSEFTEHGQVYCLSVSRASERRNVENMRALFDLLGADLFLQHCSFSLEKLDLLVSRADRERLIRRSAGARTLSAVPRLVQAA